LASFRKYLNIVAKETSRCGSIVRSLLEFARQSELKIQNLDVNSVLKKTIALLEHQMTLQEIKLTKNFKPLPEILADSSQLQQVFLNIILNAVQVMPDGGEITVSTAEGKDGFIEVRIADTGCGIPRENLPKLFDPFFTTKKGGKGIGLGLSVVYGIINRHRGKIEVESEVGKGSTFVIKLPRRRAASGSSYRSPPE
jgi:two-component system NtrC family sensor kinase